MSRPLCPEDQERFVTDKEQFFMGSGTLRASVSELQAAGLLIWSHYQDPEVRDFIGGSIIQFQILSKPIKQELLTKKHKTGLIVKELTVFCQSTLR
jgi:hypothetical protein